MGPRFEQCDFDEESVLDFPGTTKNFKNPEKEPVTQQRNPDLGLGVSVGLFWTMV